VTKRIRVRGEQREEIELTRLAQALLRAAREAAERQEAAKTKPDQEARRDA
jgi:hypothetical protein